MSTDDQERWDRKYASGSHVAGDEPGWLDELEVELPSAGTALDIACGSGRVSRWLARRGLAVTALDVSPVGLELARSQAEQAGLRLETCQRDLTREALPHGEGEGEGHWNVISCFRYLQRDLFPSLRAALAPGGFLVLEIATVRNLERHAKPSSRFLLERGEIIDLVGDLKVDYYREDWFCDQALARLVAHVR